MVLSGQMRQAMIVADLHIHSRFSRATSRELNIGNLWLWACKKGLGLVGTGDFTHPEWLAELEEQLEPDGSGFYRATKMATSGVEAKLPAASAGDVRFVLQTEISCIYKSGEKTRKVHNLVYFPDFAGVRRFVARLERIGNLHSDGRPILGLDSRDLLEIALESHPDVLFVPAHIWTPWFSALGSRSGFDSIDECYRDLAPHIHAVETGLSSDPPMNWRVPSLDRFRLLSSSDAHSPSRLGREATLFDALPDWGSLEAALREGTGYRGTLEFHPEEGKYHLDGHRKCQARLEPEDTVRLGGRCPVCGKPVTVGVLHRVHELGDGEPGRRPATAAHFESLVALDVILAEVNGVASRTARRVLIQYEDLLARYGPELTILRDLPLDDLRRVDGRLVEALDRVRSGRIHVEGGYDGEFGVVKVFSPGEAPGRTPALFPVPATEGRLAAAPTSAMPPLPQAGLPLSAPPGPHELSPSQRAVVTAEPGHRIVTAGPGSGKTRVLTERLAHLLERGVSPSGIVALTFTRRAARELRQRLHDRGGGAPLEGLFVGTFHAFSLRCINALRNTRGKPGLSVCTPQDVALLKAEKIPDGELVEALAALRLLRMERLVAEAVVALERASESELLEALPVSHLLVDEFQDIDEEQYQLVGIMAARTTDTLVMGDPNQSIYGFRGGSPAFFNRFRDDFGAPVLALATNYRSTPGIQAVSGALLGLEEAPLGAVRAAEVILAPSPTAAAEAEFIAHSIEQLLGGTANFSFNSQRVESSAEAVCSFADIAVLTRTTFAATAIEEALDRLGLPVARPAAPPVCQTQMVEILEATLRYGLNQADRLAALRLQRWERGGEALSISRLVRTIRRFRGGDIGQLAKALFVQLYPLAEAAERVCFEDIQRGSAQPSSTISDWQWHLSMLNEAERFGWRSEAIHLLTMHAAKGLEFDVVFIAGLEADLLPYALSKPPADPDEERRLLYVGLTRARQRVYLSHAGRRVVFGTTREGKRSPFLDELEVRLSALQDRPGRGRKKRPKPNQKLLL